MKKTYLFIAALLALAAGAAFGSQPMMGPLQPGGSPWWGLTGNWWDFAPPQASRPLTIDQAAESVQRYLERFWGPDFKLSEVMEFDNHFYAEVTEKSTGLHAFELLVNRWTGTAVPEPGPNIRWNRKYGEEREGAMGAWVMGGPGWRWDDWRGYGTERAASRPMPVTVQQAREFAQEFLDQRLPGSTVAEGTDTFYGYYTLRVLRDGKMYGMLGVNGYTGWVWYHEWHGRFVQAKEVKGSE